MITNRSYCARTSRAARLALLLGTIALMMGCGAGDSTRPAPPPPPPPPPPPADVWRDIAGRSWTMLGGAEGYVCLVVHVMSDEYLTGFRLAAPAPAQNEVLLTVADSSTIEGSFACSPGSLDKQLLYAANQGTEPIEFPAGFGVHVLAGQYLLLNIHINNLADTSVTDSTHIEARIGTASDVTTPIDMMMAGSFLINIPSDGQTHTSTGLCYAVADNHLLATLPFMRSAGTHQTVSVRADTTTNVIFDEDFDLKHDSYTQFATPIAMNVGDRIMTVCSYVNTSGGTLTYGESSHNESCFAAIYRYPVSATSSLYDCAQGTPSFDVRRE